ncbi:MAG: electron transfer flavoprotein subunit alpha/FixB family protein [Dissulfurimicrobium sp.]|uniref:electron transfer flavoprotein subunit alpha/FixB family protein n=1 Tax=Dissulfurimicrobium sp. TaxID=2022436 RepID=UPI00404AF05F
MKGPSIEKGGYAQDNGAEPWHGLWVAAECADTGVADVTLELLAKGRLLADKLDTEVTAVLMGSGISEFVGMLVSHGADQVFVVDHPELALFTEEVYSRVLAGLARRYRPEIILAGATSAGRAYIPGVATLLETGLTADCMDLDVDINDRTLLQTRPAWGGNLFVTITCPLHRPQMATVRPHVFKKGLPDPQRKGEIIPVQLEDEWLRHKVKVIESIREKAETDNDLYKAKVIVTAGRGVEDEKGMALVKELAALLNGAVAGTRPVVDAGWLPERAQIGQSGITVSPRLYIGLGVSGAVQHIAGIKDAEIIVAVNKDPNAPIFDIATYGLTGDLREILPELIRWIRHEKMGEVA